MLTRIQTWCNSQGIRITKIILDEFKNGKLGKITIETR